MVGLECGFETEGTNGVGSECCEGHACSRCALGCPSRPALRILHAQEAYERVVRFTENRYHLHQLELWDQYQVSTMSKRLILLTPPRPGRRTIMPACHSYRIAPPRSTECPTMCTRYTWLSTCCRIDRR